jgi:hypothetical protein
VRRNTQSSRRTLIQRARDIFDLIENEEESFPKSKLKVAGFNPDTAEKWLELIVFIQSQPRIRLIKTSRNTVVEKVEKRYSQMSLKYFLDESQPLEMRLRSLGAYADSVLVQERLHKSEVAR